MYINILNYHSARSTFGSGSNLSWAKVPKIAVEAPFLAPTKAAFDY